MPIQQMLLGGGGAVKKSYMDDVFSMNAYIGDGSSSARTITTNVNFLSATGVGTLSGGASWFKKRSTSYDHMIFDTIRGVSNGESYPTKPNSTEVAVRDEAVNSWSSTGISIGGDAQYGPSDTNGSNDEMILWNFKRHEGFFDIVTYTGNGSNRTIAHSLGSIPGMIMIKQTDGTESWRVYHRDVGGTKFLYLNGENAEASSSAYWNDTDPTASVFSLGTHDSVNQNTKNYIAYIFAGGPSAAAEARSANFNQNSSSRVTISGGHSDLAFGTGDFTLECWVKPYNLSSSLETIFDSGNNGSNNDDSIYFGFSQSQIHVGCLNSYFNQAAVTNYNNQWFHIAACRSGSTLRMFKNGKLINTTTNSTDLKSGTDVHIGINGQVGYQELNASLSNFRAVKGQALYTASFKPPTAPLTTTSQGATASNVKLLCLQHSTLTTATVTPATLSYANFGSATTDTDSPFDDLAAFKFGESGDQNLIKCGSFKADSSANANIELGFEPQWVLTKRTDSTGHWNVWDVLRGWSTTGRPDVVQRVNASNAEAETTDYGGPHSNGFESNGTMGYSGEGIYVAIRRPDGYVGKPAEAGTDVFAMDTGNSSSTIPAFDSGFTVDFGFFRAYAGADNWYTGARLIGKDRYITTDLYEAESDISHMEWDSNVGWCKTHSSNNQAWMWKRHAGFDVVAYKGNGVAGHDIPHSMNQIPEMIWVKNRDLSSEKWFVYHKDLALAAGDGGTDSEKDYFMLNEADSYYTATGAWNNTAPTSTHFTVGSADQTNDNTQNMIAMLFSSVSSISKVGSYTGTGAAWSGTEVTCGFQPRFIIIKRTDGSRNWCVYDTLRGIDNQGGGTEEKILFLNEDDAQDTAENITLSSTGFTFPGGSLNANASSGKYIFYAHA